jgi:CRISPR-associated protein (TIGR03986 family)
LLLPDTARLEVADQDSGSMKKGHKSYPVRVDADGKPLIEPSAIKGMLRAAYEAVTNSRMGVFKEHDKQLAFRSEATTSQGIEPVRINDKQIDFYSAAWLGKYKGYTRNWNGLDKHKQEVWVKVTWKKHPRKHFTYFEVVDLVNRKNGKPSSDYYEGYVCITNENMKNKHHERVFFKSGSERTSIVLTDEEVKRWKTLIENYHEQHKDELDNPPASLGITKWSRQIYMRNDEEKLKTGTLCYALMENGLIKELVPVMISRRLHEKSPAELLDKSLEPAMLITQLSPADRVFGWVRQGKAQGVSAYRGQLRIGVVECKGIKHNGTYDSNVIETFGDQGNPNTWLPLQILGQPKPQQGRFYVAKNKNGEAQERGLNNEQAGYNKDEKGLRGRKVYPHHASVPSNYWVDDKALKTELDTRQSDLSQEALQSSGKTYFREYIRPKSSDRRDKQNRSIQGWVKPGTEFEFDIHFTNLSEVELGALVWLLSLNDENENKYFHRFGGGKPLGFGSVKLELTDTKISSGEDLKAFYASLDIKPTSSKTADDYKSAFERAIAAAYPGVSFLDAFKVACTGFSDGLPIHYPRARRYEVKNNQVQYITATGQPTTDSAPVPPHPDGLAYEWFVANSKESIKERDQLDILPTSNPGQKEIKPRYTLKDLSKDDGLPILPHKK